MVVVLQPRRRLPLDSGHDHDEADNAWTGDVPRHANGRHTGDGEIYYRRYSISISSKYIRMVVATWRDDLEHLSSRVGELNEASLRRALNSFGPIDG